VIEELLLLARADARANDVRIKLQLAADLPCVAIDRIQIQQVLFNLVRNAIEAVAELPEDRREVCIASRSDGPCEIELTVADQGPGVAPAMLERLFTPFATDKPQGSGFGLAISRTIVESHHGSLRYLPVLPRGACFAIRLPVTTEHS
jgi:two-component system, LuxR family, sensor kinase FixL